MKFNYCYIAKILNYTYNLILFASVHTCLVLCLQSSVLNKCVRRVLRCCKFYIKFFNVDYSIVINKLKIKQMFK